MDVFIHQAFIPGVFSTARHTDELHPPSPPCSDVLYYLYGHTLNIKLSPEHPVINAPGIVLRPEKRSVIILAKTLQRAASTTNVSNDNIIHSCLFTFPANNDIATVNACIDHGIACHL